MSDEALDGYLGPTAALAPRSAALGILLLLSTLFYWRRDARHRLDTMQGPITGARQACRAVYAALFVGIALPTVTWHCADPLNVVALGSMRRGAGICFIFGLMTLLAVRIQSLPRDAVRPYVNRGEADLV